MRKDYTFPHFNIVLFEPEIPPNTGSIARLAVGVGASLHLVGKLGFSTDERAVKRAGLDYWKHLDLHYHDSLEALWAKYPDGRFFYATTKTARLYTDVSFKPGDFLVFGPETRGLPADVIAANPGSTITIPMTGIMRSLNLSNAVSVVSYELVRQMTSGNVLFHF